LALSPKLLDFASRLRALAVDGIVEGSARELVSKLGTGTDRTLRTKLQALEAEKVLERENERGGAVRVAFLPRERKEERKERKARTEERKREGGGGEGQPSSQTKDASKESGAAAAMTRTEERTEERKTRTEGLPEWHVRVTLEGTPTALAPLLAALGGDVSPGKVAKGVEVVDLELDEPTDEERALIQERFAQMADDGDPVRSPQVMGAKVLKDVRTKPAVRNGLASSLADRQAKAAVAEREKGLAERNAAARAEVDRQLKENSRRALQETIAARRNVGG